MKKNNLIFLIVCFTFFTGCQEKRTKLEFYSKVRQDSINCKIGYIFYRKGGTALDFYPCKPFDISNKYGGLSPNHLEEGFQQSWNTINYNDFLKILNSADTFLMKYNNPISVDTVLIVPAYFEYRNHPIYSNINQYRKITFNEYQISFLNKILHMKAYFKVYQIDKIIPLKPYNEKPVKSSKDTFLIM